MRTMMKDEDKEDEDEGLEGVDREQGGREAA